MSLITYEKFQTLRKQGLNSREISKQLNRSCPIPYTVVLNGINITATDAIYKGIRIPISDFLNIPSFAEIGRKYNLDRSTVRYIGAALGIETDRATSNRFRRQRLPSLSPIQKQIVLGTLMGDAWIDEHFSYGFGQCVAKENYVYHVYDQLSNLATNCPKLKKKRDKDGKIYYSRYFTCKVTDEFEALRVKFYPNLKKLVPYDLIQTMDGQALAYWYMDDGGTDWSKSKGDVVPFARIFTLGFNESDHDVLIDYFNTKWGIDAKKRRHNAGTGWMLCFDKINTQKFFEIIKPHIHPEMFYKVVFNELCETSSQ